jgi:predicted GIY-YIG superfamily endonuclease
MFDLPVVTEPNFVAWLEFVGDHKVAYQYGKPHDSALAAWTRHRVCQPTPHVVYLLKFGTGARYVGIAQAATFKDRLRAHQRAAEGEKPLRHPGEFFVAHHGQFELEAFRIVPDRVAAWLTEALWTCEIAARGVEAFGSDPAQLCPAKAWCEPRGWGRNWVNPRVPDVTFLVAADDTVRTIYTT